MKTLFQIIAACIALIAIVTLHLSSGFLLPYPFENINILFIFLTILILLRDAGSIVWLAFFAHLFIELYAASPFGIIVYAGTMSTLAIYWLHKYVLTNRSWITAIVLAIIAIAINRGIYLVLYNIAEAMSSNAFAIQANIIPLFWEMLLTSITVGMISFILSLFVKSMNQRTIYS